MIRDKLQHRANLLAAIRAFFSERGVLEVDVPSLGKRSVTDPNIDALSCAYFSQTLYLQTSPEYLMKRLLAQGSGDIYYLGKSFRYDQAGKQHNPEFTMLEWYRCGWDGHQLVQELVDLICACCQKLFSVNRVSYRDVFMRFIDLDPHKASDQELEKYARRHLNVSWNEEPRSLWLDLLFSHIIEPQMGAQLTVIHDYPKCSAALAKIAKNELGQEVAKRFEVYWHGLELANGYEELTDVDALTHRFEQDLIQRQRAGKDVLSIDEAFLNAMASGIPSCAGVALGIDRLLMCLTNTEHIDSVLNFSLSNL